MFLICYGINVIICFILTLGWFGFCARTQELDAYIMSGNWDDSGSDADVAIVEKPVILPRARQPSIAKSLEKAVILESSVAGSVKESDARNAADQWINLTYFLTMALAVSSDDESASIGSVASEDFLESADEVLVFDFDTTTNMKKMFSQFECSYRNIISEFADVEIFVISIDSLIVECLAHSYHDWTLSGQSIVLTKQIDRFLNQFVNFGGKFKLVVFTDFASQFSRDTTLGFARATAISYVSAGPFAKVLYLKCWFVIISYLDLIYFTSPVDPCWDHFLHDITPSFVMISTDNVTKEVCAQDDLDITLQLETIVLDTLSRTIPVVLLTSVVVNFSSVFAYYINPRLCIIGSVSEHFESLCCAVLLSSLIIGKRGPSRIYLPEKKDGKRGLDVIRDRRLLLTTATNYLEKLDFTSIKFSLADFWDGRMVICCFDAICSNEPVLPYRLQEDFVRLHTAAALTKSIPTDTLEKLLDPLPEVYRCFMILMLFNNESKDIRIVIKVVNPLSTLPFLYAVESPLLEKYIPEMKTANSNEIITDGVQPDYVALLRAKMSWKLKHIEEDFTKIEIVIDECQKKKANRLRQVMYRWYEIFANSLEGRGTNLLVDFSRVPKGFAQVNSDTTCEPTPKKSGKGWTGQKGLKQRVEAVTFVGRLKDSFVIHWPYLDSRQKEQVVDLWAALGFEVPLGMKASAEAKMKRLDLEMNLIYYQLEYGGELIDIQSDPRKDDRVTGFAPDAWQRKMLDSVDRGNSAVIVAPTSAGKTFVSYYCIERVLRQSDDDVVVYVSPSKALINQVCGSIYARFRNKSMTRGKSLLGMLNPEHSLNPLSCQVLVTVPESFEALLLSNNSKVQEFVSHIRYVVFDEVHSIGSSLEAHIWEHLLLLIQCPFLALSATIGNTSKLHSWLDHAERSKTSGRRKVDLIVYHERYSELELSIMRVAKPQPIEAPSDGNNYYKCAIKVIDMPVPREIVRGNIIQPFMPYGVFMPEKIRMFGIPDDHQLTAKQILELYTTMAAVDDKTKSKYLAFFLNGPSKSILFSIAEKNLSRVITMVTKQVIDILVKPIEEQLDYRAVPFNKEKLALDNIVPLVDEMNSKNMLPAMCFNDDRYVCEALAIRLAEELEAREMEFVNSAEFKKKYAIKYEDKYEKLAKRNRDKTKKKEKKRKKITMKIRMRKENETIQLMKQIMTRLQHKELSSNKCFQSSFFNLLEYFSIRIFYIYRKIFLRFRLRGRGSADPDVYEKMVNRMMKGSKEKESTRTLIRLFERGIGYHHGGLNNFEKVAVEVLYRSGHLGIIFTTSTLALGVNMPCKTVLFGVDTPFLTPLLFRQMSGRAGRRGFDHSGAVCFMSIPTSKMRRLLTASLSTLQGNPPFSTSFILRLLSHVHDKDNLTDSRTNTISTFGEREKCALSLLTNSFSLFTRNEAANGTLQKQLKMYTAYSVQLLRHLQLLDRNCSAKNLAELAASLAKVKGEPGNLLFIYLLQRGAFHLMLKQTPDKVKAKLKMVTVLANLFTRERLPFWIQADDKSSFPSDSQDLIFLNGLPKEMQDLVDEYNKVAISLYHTFMSAASPDRNLLAYNFLLLKNDGVFRIFKAAEFSNGRPTTSRLLVNDELIFASFDGYSHDSSFIPVIDFDHRDHRGRKCGLSQIWYNAFAVAFYVHKSRLKLFTMNRIRHNIMWYIIHDFVTILQRLAEGLEVVARQQDPVAEIVREIYTEYISKFRSAFGMRNKN
ncbi:DEAD/DEAH box helicase [Dictyocaulus viviparus]|uniref:DEAD/DEAH box helicase n=1 Tax=Dictyocaulus viviparus TaxID=29172 RepID=A0A0D8Y249_DICVI|nr:DEAD/DEAH box helicase [Dictyocaulus viviparus]